MSLTAGTSGHVLIKALKRAGWGNLAGADFRGVRVVYTALIEMLDGKTGQGKATVWQIGEQAGYSEGWTRRCLQILEELELITWDRGGVVEGKAIPSWFRVSKRALLLLVAIARTQGTERLAEHQAAVRGRIAGYRRLHRTKRRTQTRRSNHPTLDKDLLSNEEVPRAYTPPRDAPAASLEAMKDAVAGIRANIRAQRGLSRPRGRDSKTATTTESAEQAALHTADSAHNHASQLGGSAQ